MLTSLESALVPLLLLSTLLSACCAYVLWRVSFENPGIITKSISGGVAAPRKRAESDDDGPSAVRLAADRREGAAGVEAPHPPQQPPGHGNAVIAAPSAGQADRGLPERKAAVAKPRRQSTGEGGALAAGGLINGEERLPDWEIDHRKLRFKYVVGKGNFGEVWLATWLGSPVAVKTIVPELQNKEKLVKRFQDEILLMSTLHHPNVVLFLGACTRKPNLCLVIEYCSHGSLHHFLKNEATHGVRITMSLVLRFALDIARGVYYLHRRCSVVQRDLKARNILVDESLNAKVADFGLSRVLDEQEQNKLTACGTPAWTAPEIVKMEAYTDKVDVYSFGIILWELLTREEPYGGQKGVQIAYAAAEQGLRPEVPAYCPQDYADLMRQCWADNPGERPSFAQILKKLFQMKKACDVEAEKALTDPSAKAFFLQPLPKYSPSNAGGAMIETRHGPKSPPLAAHPPAAPAVDIAAAGDRPPLDPAAPLPGAVNDEAPPSPPLAQHGTPTTRAMEHGGGGGGAPPSPDVGIVPSADTKEDEGSHGSAPLAQRLVDRGIVRVRSTLALAHEWDGDVGDSDDEEEGHKGGAAALPRTVGTAEVGDKGRRAGGHKGARPEKRQSASMDALQEETEQVSIPVQQH